MSILVTSFEPFAGRKTNLSQTAVRTLYSSKSSDHWARENVVFSNLPVGFNNVETIVKKLIDEHSVTRILLTGENRKAPRIHLERLALNVAHGNIADNSGVRLSLDELDPAEPLALMTGINIELVSRMLKKARLPNCISHHGGTFVCNAAYYHALKNCRNSLFVHLPAKLPGGRPRFGMSHGDCLAKALSIVLQYMISHSC